jgi:peptidoglycan hydrolase-like protein with peptidoglycan-binding domain
VLCYEVGLERTIECRLDTHVIQLTRELAQGMSGSDVSALQTRLQRFGFSGAVDGVFGTVTAAAVGSFQSGTGLAATGVADKQTLAALGFDVSGIP